jgi:voltage-gated potassium channel
VTAGTSTTGGAGQARAWASDDELAKDGVRGLKRRPAEERERGVELLASRLDRPIAVLGVVFLLVVLGQNTATSPQLQRAFVVTGTVLWAVFVGEFLLRLYLAPSKRRFFRRNWWQVIFLVIPALRFLRVLALLRVVRVGSALRVVRAGGVLGSAVRSSRSSARLLSSRLGWVGAVSVIVVLASSQLLHAFVGLEPYGDALHAAAVTTITGNPLDREEGLAKVLDVVLGAYSVAVFAALAGTLGAYFLEQRQEDRARAGAPADPSA